MARSKPATEQSEQRTERSTGLRIRIDNDAETIEIEGIVYTFEIFRHLGLGPVGPDHFFQLENRRDGVVTIRQFTRAGLVMDLCQAIANEGDR